jgi:hypothetical protein
MSRNPPPDESTDSLQEIAASLQATQEGLSECLEVASRRAWKPGESNLPHPALRILAEVGGLLETSRERLEGALAALPVDADYADYAARLRTAAEPHAELTAVLAQAPKLSLPLREAMEGLAAVAADLGLARDRLNEAGRALSVDATVTPIEAIHQTLASLRELADVKAASTASAAFVAAAQTAGTESETVVEEPALVAALHPELEALTASLRAIADLAAPLVDSLSDLSHLTEQLKAVSPPLASAPAPTPVPAGHGDVGDWAGDILRAVRELAEAVATEPPADAAQEQRLWESVRDLHLEVVNLKGALLSPTRRAPSDPSGR